MIEKQFIKPYKIRRKDMIKILKVFIRSIKKAKKITKFTVETIQGMEEVPQREGGLKMKATGWTDIKIKARFLTSLKGE